MQDESLDEARGVKQLATKTIFFYQLRALFLKNLTLHRRNVATLLCQVIAPVVIISVAGFLQMLFDVIMDNYDNTIPGSGQVSIYSDSTWMTTCKINTSAFPTCPKKCYLDVLNIEYINNNSSNKLDMPWANQTMLSSLVYDYYPPQRILFDLPFVYYINDAGVDLGCLTPNGTQIGFLGNSLPPPFQYNFSLNFTISSDFQDRHFHSNPQYNGNTVQVPFFLELSSLGELVDRLVTVSKDYSRLGNGTKSGDDQFERNYIVQPISQLQYETVLKYVQAENYSMVRPHGGVVFKRIEHDHFSYILVAPLLLVYDYVPGDVSTLDTCRRVMVANLVHNAYFKYLTGNNEAGDPMIETLVMPLPSDPTDVIYDIAVVLGGLLYPFAFSLTIPVFVASLVKDKHERHVIMMEQCGLSRPAYTIVTYVFNYCLYLFIAMVISVMSLAFRIRLYTQTNALVLLVMMVTWGHAAVVMGFFFSNFFIRPRTAVVMTYLLVIAGVVISLMVNLFQLLSENRTPPFIYMMYPPFSFYRILFYLNKACTQYHCYSSYMLIPHGSNLFLAALLYLGVSSLVTMVISIYLSYVMPSEYGVTKSPLFPIIALYRLLWSKCRCSQQHSVSYSINRDEEEEQTTIITQYSNNDSCDDDVIVEEEYINNSYDVIDAPVVLNKLRKEYDSSNGSYVAVYGFSIVVKRNECFGLLGPNGAGKTTLISLLTGLYEPTNGTARVAGYDLTTESHMISTHLGVCPQHDIHYDELTTMEHLLFYARLRGVCKRYERSVVTAAMKQVNLVDAANKRARQLSGGMRRRLSVAIACLADPDIIVLDEPTTGLDPASRRQVWDVINNVKQNKSVILTTHAMEEADQLCTRIGIMNHGKLRCLGSQSRLKARYGLGYQLHINLYPGRLHDIQQFISSHLPAATLVEYFSCKISYKIDKEQLVVSELFSLLDSVKMQLGISDWGIKRTTLEDVFLTIVAKHHDDRMVNMETRSCSYWLPSTCQYCHR